MDTTIVCHTRVGPNPSATQRETAVVTVSQNCQSAVIGTWIDKGNGLTPASSRGHIAISRSNDGGRTWQAPANPIASCPSQTDPRRFLNDCYFIGDCGLSPSLPTLDCGALEPGGPPDCNLPPLGNETLWEALDNEVCTGGHENSPGGLNGTLYVSAISFSNENPGLSGLLLCRSSDRGATFDLFTLPGVPPVQRRIKHVCDPEAVWADRPAIAASPVSDDVFLFWYNTSTLDIEYVHSPDRGDTFPSRAVLQETPSGADAWAPSGATDADGNLFVVWPYSPDRLCGGTLEAETAESIRFRWRERATGAWTPLLTSPPSTAASAFTIQPRAAPPPPGFTEYGAPSIAIDQTRINGQLGPYHGRIYVVYSERSSCTAPFSYRLKLVWSCDRGENWIAPLTISPDVAHENESLQVYPRVRVDGRGTVFVSWYDTRFKTGTAAGSPYYDVFARYSLDGADTWSDEVRLSGAGTQPAFFRFDGEQSRDYSGMTTEPTLGTSGVCVLAMGRTSGQTFSSIHSFKILVRGLGDFDGDFDLDCNDAQFDYCLSLPTETLECECKLLDLDHDGDLTIDDIALFDQRIGGSAPTCHSCSHTDPGCNGAALAIEDGGPERVARERPRLRGCDLAMSYATYAAPDTATALVERLYEWLRERADDARALETYEFAECLRAALR